MTTTQLNNDLARKPNPETAERIQQRQVLTPAVDVFENADGLLIVADLPAVKEEDMDIRFEKNVLHLRGTARTVHPVSGQDMAFDWVRSFAVPGGVNAEKISAELKHGVLRVLLPPDDRLKPRQIQVRAG
jgi:HSP20 family molecular chaperone IbpA